jgi:phage gpG-like protein
MVTISMEMKGFENVRGMFQAVVAQTRQPERLLKPWGAILQSETARVFRAQANPTNNAPWPRPSTLTLGSRPGGGGGGKALLDTGRLRNALVSRTPRYTKDSVAITTEGVIYAALHQFGGEIVPVNAKMLAVPLTRDARRAGSARRWWENNKSAKPFVFTSGKGKKLIATANKEGALEFHFVLLPKVTVPARPFLGISETLRNRVLATTARVYAQILRENGARGGGS